MDGGGHGDEYHMVARTFNFIISQLLNIQNPPQPQNPNPNHDPPLQNPNPNPDIQNPNHDPPLQNPNPDIQNPEHDDDDQSSSEPRLPAEFRASLASMGADDATFIFARKLYDSDVDRGLNRLTIPRTQIKERFLRDEEEELLRQKDEYGKVKKLRVRVLDPKLNERSLTLSRWKYDASKNSVQGSCSYVLNGGWFDLVNENGLKKDTHIQLWSFRVNGSLGFVINVVKDDQNSDQASTSTAIASGNGSSSDDGGSDGIFILPSWGRKNRRGSNASRWRNY